MIHAGGEMEFIRNALLMWKANKKTGDYHHQMSQTNYEKWMKEMLIPNLPENSIVVLNNASYHNVVVDKSAIFKQYESTYERVATERKYSI